MVDKATANCKGVIEINPWPIEVTMVSPGYHGSFKYFLFHSFEGNTPLFSFNKSIPVFSPNPKDFAYVDIKSMPKIWPKL